MRVHVKGDAMSFASRLRTSSAAVDPMLRLFDVQSVDNIHGDLVWLIRLWMRITVLISAVALLLSLAGIYAV